MIDILYQDRDIVVCVKPVGMLSQAGKPGQASMVTALEQQLGGTIYPVHRLDRETGGVMVYGRNQEAAGDLGRQIQQGSMVKEYLAVLQGIPEQKEGLLEDLLYHDRTRNKTYVVKRSRKGVREARLIYRVLAEKDDQSLIQVRLLTGRTHQIRAQFAARALPLAGDGPYGGGSGSLALQAIRLTFRMKSGQVRSFEQSPEQLGEFAPITPPEPIDVKKFPKKEKST